MEQHYAIVLRTVNYKDSDKLLTLFSRKSGPITATARGVRKAKSRLKPAAQLFCCGEFEFQPAKGGRLILTGVNIRQEFYQIQNTYEKYTAACVMLEFTEKLLHNTDEYERLFVA
ncbi:MAG: DNA repair protein RecO, partial [Christensenellaceae bacterium]